MDKNTKHTMIGIAAVLLVMVALFAGVYSASGVSPPQTIVVSESMQHSPANDMHSILGVIDTGDMIILKSKGSEEDMDIRSYVDGFKSGYSQFGLFGDVIIYEREGENPIIHRAILWLESNGDGTWNAPSLEGYPDDRWSCVYNPGISGEVEITDYNRLYGTLEMKYMGWNGNVTVRINLDVLQHDPSGGFLTMGDHNNVFDEGTPIAGNSLVSYERIRSVAWFEVPWVGAFKMIMDGKTDDLDRLVPNTIPNLIVAVLFLVFILIGISFLIDYRYFGKYKKELHEEMNALPPSFPVEEEKE